MKDVEWIGAGKEDLMDLPQQVRVEIGHSLLTGLLMVIILLTFGHDARKMGIMVDR